MLLTEGSGDYENVGFHAQQAAEKFIKAFLVRHQVEFPKSHNVALLRQLVARVDPRLAETLAAADALTPEKQKTIVSLVERILATKKKNPAANTSALEREIDQQVYALYDLTPEEIKIVEESAK